MRRKFKADKYPKTSLFVVVNDTVRRRCNRCGAVVLKEKTVKGYPYQCVFCDENLYAFETHIGDPHTEKELDALFCQAINIFSLDKEG